MSSRKCYRCGKDPAEGYASIWKDGVEKWYCHGDDDLTCYEQAQMEYSGIVIINDDDEHIPH